MEKFINYLNSKGRWTNLVWGIGSLIVLTSLTLTVTKHHQLALILSLIGLILPVFIESFLDKYSKSNH